jgi:hypothetical protein
MKKTTTSIILYFIFAIILSSCGFKPVYKNNETNQTAEYLPSIKIEEGKVSIREERTHRMFYDRLESELYTDSENSKYKLTTILSESISATATKSSGSTGRYNYTLKVHYKLLDKDDKEISSGHVKSIASYESIDERFTTYSLRKDTLNKLIDSTIEKLKLKIIADLQNKS